MKYIIIIDLLVITTIILLLITVRNRDDYTVNAAHELLIIRSFLDDKGCEKLQRAFPEGAFFGLVLYGLTWAQLAQIDTNEQNSGRAYTEALWAYTKLENSESIRSKFGVNLEPPYGVFYNGWLNLLCGNILRISKLENKDTILEKKFKARCNIIAQSFKSSACIFLPSYKGSAWPADNVVAVASLALHDKMFEKKYDTLQQKWLNDVAEYVDKSTGLVPHAVNPENCSVIEGPRGSSQVLMNRFWPVLSREFAKDQFDRFKMFFGTKVIGCSMVREYPKGKPGLGDIDSGPVIFGAGATASIVGLAAYRANNDLESLDALNQSVNLLKSPLLLAGKHRFASTDILIGELFILWAKVTPDSCS